MLLLVKLVLRLLAQNFAVTDLLQNVSTDRVMLFFLEVIVRVLQVVRPMLAGVSVNASNETVLLGVNFLLVFLRVLRDISLVFELLLDSAEFYSTLVGSLQEKLLGVRESVDHF